MEIIAQRKNSFGIEKEKFDRLKIIKGSLKDSFKFYFISVIMMSVLSSIDIYELVFTTEFHFDIKIIVALLSQCANIMVVSIVLSRNKAAIKACNLQVYYFKKF